MADPVYTMKIEIGSVLIGNDVTLIWEFVQLFNGALY